MATRVVEGKKPYTWGKAIEIDENKVISLRLRDENNLIIWDEWDNEIYVDLQLDDEITPTSAFPVWITTGRVIVDNWWDEPWTIICAKTTSGDNIKLLYADSGNLYIDNWTWTFKQIYLKADVDALLLALRSYIDDELAKKQNWVASATAPTNPSEWDLWYDTVNDQLQVYDGSQWNATWSGGWLPSGWTLWQMIVMSANWPIWVDVQSPTAIALDKNSIELSTVWATEQLTATVTPSSAVVTQVSWSSDDDTVATVSSTWLVTCVTPWDCTITASTINWLTATCSVSEWGGWTPSANTLLYIPMDATYWATDQSQYQRTFSVSWMSHTTWPDGADCYSISSWWIDLGASSVSWMVPASLEFTGSFWVYDTHPLNILNSYTQAFGGAIQNEYYIGLWWMPPAWQQYTTWLGISWGRPWEDDFWIQTNDVKSTWTLIGFTIKNWVVSLYRNWVLWVDTSNLWFTIANNWFGSWHTTTKWIRIWCSGDGNDGMDWYLGEVVFEDVAWDATAWATYFDQTKSRYGIS